MRLPRVRFTVRGMMAAIAAAVALLVAWVAISIRAAGFSEVATGYRVRWSESRYQAREAKSVREAERYGTLAAYHERMFRHYENAARYPWLPIGPDPPEPK